MYKSIQKKIILTLIVFFSLGNYCFASVILSDPMGDSMHQTMNDEKVGGYDCFSKKVDCCKDKKVIIKSDGYISPNLTKKIDKHTTIDRKFVGDNLFLNSKFAYSSNSSPPFINHFPFTAVIKKE